MTFLMKFNYLHEYLVSHSAYLATAEAFPYLEDLSATPTGLLGQHPAGGGGGQGVTLPTGLRILPAGNIRISQEIQLIHNT